MRQKYGTGYFSHLPDFNNYGTFPIYAIYPVCEMARSGKQVRNLILKKKLRKEDENV
jgi:hypothetical protein